MIPFLFLLLRALSMCVVFSPNGTHPFDMGDFRVLATARRTQVRLRVAVLLKSPHLKRLRSAKGANKRRRWHYRHRSTGRLVALYSLRYFVSVPPAAIIAESASPCFVARLRFRLTRTSGGILAMLASRRVPREPSLREIPRSFIAPHRQVSLMPHEA